MTSLLMLQTSRVLWPTWRMSPVPSARLVCVFIPRNVTCSSRRCHSWVTSSMQQSCEGLAWPPQCRTAAKLPGPGLLVLVVHQGYCLPVTLADQEKTNIWMEWGLSHGFDTVPVSRWGSCAVLATLVTVNHGNQCQKHGSWFEAYSVPYQSAASARSARWFVASVYLRYYTSTTGAEHSGLSILGGLVTAGHQEDPVRRLAWTTSRMAWCMSNKIHEVTGQALS